MYRTTANYHSAVFIWMACKLKEFNGMIVFSSSQQVRLLTSHRWSLVLGSRPFLGKESPMDLKTEPSLTSNDTVRCRLLKQMENPKPKKKNLRLDLGLPVNLPCKGSKAADPHWQLLLKGTITPLLRSMEIFISFIWLGRLRWKENNSLST